MCFNSVGPGSCGYDAGSPVWVRGEGLSLLPLSFWVHRMPCNETSLPTMTFGTPENSAFLEGSDDIPNVVDTRGSVVCGQ